MQTFSQSILSSDESLVLFSHFVLFSHLVVCVNSFLFSLKFLWHNSQLYFEVDSFEHIMSWSVMAVELSSSHPSCDSLICSSNSLQYENLKFKMCTRLKLKSFKIQNARCILRTMVSTNI